MEDKMHIDEKEKKPESSKPKGEAVNSEQIKRSKAKQDFSPQLEEKLPKARQLAHEGKLHEALELLLALEKQTRSGEDELSTIKVACTAVTLCFEAKDHQALRDTLVHISKRRGQTKDVIQKMVAEAMTFVDKIDDMPKKLELIDTLRLITEGKIFVEIERARLTRILVGIKESEGKIAEAADILQEVQVETYGAMDPREKIDFILEQMRLCLAKSDYIRAQIISRKVTAKALENTDFQDLKLRYYDLMVQFYAHESDYLNICRSFLAMYNTPSVQESAEQWKAKLKYVVLYVVLSPRGTEQSDLLHRVNLDKKLLEIPEYQSLLNHFIQRTVVRWPLFEKSYLGELDKLPVFKTSARESLLKDLHARVVEHNIGVIAEYYERINTSRLSQLLDLSDGETEQFISKMVSSASVYAKIDRPKGIVSFTKRKEPNEVLNNWSHDVVELLGLLEKTCHLIHRETMVHNL
eukprot:TRINITY_DN1173_c0_g1_i1.p1 TRINITY_DN1173_c0_g1~~TRINITY_DN1173_c0_g1_i1.p1  ORF type:complete len:466 (-),score=98.64 TRINITY_DN1173_c0_g1_i1:67-1464(-)